MDIDTQLETYLATLTSLPIAWNLKPRGITDCVVCSRIPGTKRQRSHEGKLYDVISYQIDVYGAIRTNARSNANLIKNNLDGNHTNFVLATLNNDFDLPEFDTNLWRVVLSFSIYTN